MSIPAKYPKITLKQFLRYGATKNETSYMSFGSQTALTHCATIHCTINVPHHQQYMVLWLILTGTIT